MVQDPGARDPAALPQHQRLPAGTRLAAVTSSYHGELTRGMLTSATDTLEAAGLAPGHLLAIEAPGAYELPLLAQRLAQREDVHGVLCFGLVLKGETDHDVHIAGAVAHALQQVALDTGKPVLFGLLTCGNLEQAQRRARRRQEGGLDKGHEVALAAIGALHGLGAAAGAFPAGGGR